VQEGPVDGISVLRHPLAVASLAHHYMVNHTFWELFLAVPIWHLQLQLVLVVTLIILLPCLAFTPQPLYRYPDRHMSPCSDGQPDTKVSCSFHRELAAQLLACPGPADISKQILALAPVQHSRKWPDIDDILGHQLADIIW